MNNETRKMIDRVEQLTGYKVSVGSDTGFSGFAQMVTATPRNPIHVINVNRKYSEIGDYVVALQCAMILTKWSDPDKIPIFIVDKRKVDDQIEKCVKSEKLLNIEPDAARQFASHVVNGLLHQLLSIPAEMIAMNICSIECPGLRDMMITAANNEIQEAHQCLDPKITQVVPEDIFLKNAAMNAAFAVKWSQISGNQHILVPFMALDVLEKGKELLKIFDDIPDTDVQKYSKAIDGWACMLELTSYYKWEFMEK